MYKSVFLISLINIKIVIMASSSHYVFVYGTLKKGEPNHSWFTKDNRFSKFICNAQTNEKYPLIIATRYNIPFLLYSPGNGSYVNGEIYEVDDKILANLDVLEDHPNFYIREKLVVKRLDSSENIITWTYFIKNFKSDLLNRPTFENYSSNGDHGLTYVESEQSTIEDLNS